jgi:lysozyme
MKSSPKNKLTALLGTTAAAALLAFVVRHEGLVTTAYIDATGTPTVCVGETDPALAVPGAAYSADQCLRMLEDRLTEFAAAVGRSTPAVMDVPELAVPAIDLAYNIGAAAYDRSTTARHFRAGRWREGCAAMKRFVYSKGRKLRGLEIRRENEFALCLQGAAAKEGKGDR